MYLELADGTCTACLSDDGNQDMIPVVDDDTGEIYMINVDAFAQLTPGQQYEALTQAPMLMYMIESDADEGQMDGKLFDRIKNAVGNFAGKVREKITGSPDIPIFPWKRTPEQQAKKEAIDKGVQSITGTNFQTRPGILENILNPQSQNQQRFGGSFSIEPDPKPWFARPEVLIPGLIAVGVGVWAITRN